MRACSWWARRRGSGGRSRSKLAAAGARVVLAARRADKLAEAAAEAGDRAAVAVCDVRDGDQCDAVVRDAVEQLGGLDIVVYATAVDPLVRLVDTDADRWRAVFETNVFGASLVTRAALAPLTESGGRMVYISATSVGRPLPGMGAYETSKAALDELVRAWRGEHPEIGFCNVAVGNTLGTEVYQSWDPRAPRRAVAGVGGTRVRARQRARCDDGGRLRDRGAHRDGVAGRPPLRGRQPRPRQHHGRLVTRATRSRSRSTWRRCGPWLEARIPDAEAVELLGMRKASSGFSADTVMVDVAVTRGGIANDERYVLRTESPEPADLPGAGPGLADRDRAAVPHHGRGGRATPTCRSHR